MSLCTTLYAHALPADTQDPRDTGTLFTWDSRLARDSRLAGRLAETPGVCDVPPCAPQIEGRQKTSGRALLWAGYKYLGLHGVCCALRCILYCALYSCTCLLCCIVLLHSCTFASCTFASCTFGSCTLHLAYLGIDIFTSCNSYLRTCISYLRTCISYLHFVPIITYLRTLNVASFRLVVTRRPALRPYKHTHTHTPRQTTQV